MSFKEWVFLGDNGDYFYDTVSLFLSTVFGIVLGLNLEFLLNIYYEVISKLGSNQLIMFAGIAGIAVLFEFFICVIPQYILDASIDLLNRKNSLKTAWLFNSIFSYIAAFIFKAINYIFVFLMVSFMFISVLRYGEDEKFFYSKLYTYNLSKKIVNQMIDNNYMQYFIRRNEIYNGVNMKKAMEIDLNVEFEANKIVENTSTDLEKARLIYNWVGTNIMYDDDLAKDIENKEIDDTLGAKYAFYNRSGVCFEFATLFGAMADSVGLPVKVVIGNAFNGVEFGPHAWNEVYLEDEKRWISVDPTFWGQSSSFNSRDFDSIHEKERVAWQNTNN